MKRYISLLTLFLITTISTCSASIFLVHGSFAKHAPWYQEGGAFHSHISKHDNTISFSWSASPLGSYIIEAAHDLAQAILECPYDDEITLIGHSNGGNVIAYATSLLHYAMKPEIDDDTAEKRLYDLIHEAVDEDHISRATVNNPAEYARLRTSARNAYLAIYEKMQHRLQRGQQSLIKYIYMMGTPIHKHTFTVHMDIVEHVYNLYSQGDYVQPLVGNQIITPHEQITNLNVRLKKEDGTIVAPCHHTIHHETVAKWLLQVPNIVAQHPESTCHDDGDILFAHNEKPQYTPKR